MLLVRFQHYLVQFMISGIHKHGGCCCFGTFFSGATEKASIFALEMKCFTPHFSFLFSLFLHEGVNCFCHMEAIVVDQIASGRLYRR
jgi:hypothetical protein